MQAGIAGPARDKTRPRGIPGSVFEWMSGKAFAFTPIGPQNLMNINRPI